MPQDCFHPQQIKWHHSMSLQSHVSHIDFTHLSKAAQQSLKHKLPLPAAPSLMVLLGPTSLRLIMAHYLSSREKCSNATFGASKVLKNTSDTFGGLSQKQFSIKLGIDLLKFNILISTLSQNNWRQYKLQESCPSHGSV